MLQENPDELHLRNNSTIIKTTHPVSDNPSVSDIIDNFIKTISQDIKLESIEQVAVPTRRVENLWMSPQSIAALWHLISAAHSAAILYLSGLPGTGSSVSQRDLNMLKKELDGIVTEEILNLAKKCPIRIRVCAGEGQVPKKGDIGRQPGLYVGQGYGGAKNSKDEMVADIAIDPIDGTTSLAKGEENIPHPPTALISVFKAKAPLVFTRNSRKLKEVPDCFAVMGHMLYGKSASLFNAGKMWDGENFNFKAIEKYMNAQAAEKRARFLNKAVGELSDLEMEGAKENLRIVIHKREKN